MPSHSHITSVCLLHFDSRGRRSGVTLSLLFDSSGRGRVLHYRYFLTAGEK